MESEMCSDKNKTSLIVHTGPFSSNGSNTWSCNVSKTILLLQEPEERAKLEFSLTYSDCSNTAQNYGYSHNYNSTFRFNYSFALTFENNLHNVSEDYGYKIDFSVYKHEKDFSSHTLLFSQKEMRETNKILISKQSSHDLNRAHPEIVDKLRMYSYKSHICCSIQRFNVKIAEVSKLPSPHMDFGAMLFQTGLYSDVTLVVGEKLFSAHKHVLCCVSNIFKAMFSHDMVENQNGKVIIEDFHPEVIEGLLSFIYTGKTSLLSKTPIELFQVAHKYEIQILKTLCMEQFLFTLNTENVVDILYTASMYELIDLKNDLFKFIESHEEKMVKEESFQEYLCKDLKVNTVVYTLKLCDKYEEFLKNVETEVFKFVIKNSKTLAIHKEFTNLFETHSLLMKRLYVFEHKNY